MSSKKAVLWLIVLMLAVIGLVPAAAARTVRKASLQEESAPDVPRITVEELKEKLAKHSPITIIDSRSEGAWDGSNEKIVGAIRIPLDQIESHFKQLSHRKPIVVYCS